MNSLYCLAGCVDLTLNACLVEVRYSALHCLLPVLTGYSDRRVDLGRQGYIHEHLGLVVAKASSGSALSVLQSLVQTRVLIFGLTGCSLLVSQVLAKRFVEEPSRRC